MLIPLLVAFILLVFSAIISASEVAFFSLSPAERETLRKAQSANDKTAASLLDKPKTFLATILIANNLANIGIVLLSSFLASEKLSQMENPVAAFLLQVVAVTFIILLFGEVIPKVFANHHALKMARLLAFPIAILEKIFFPLSFILIASTSFLDKKVKRKVQAISVEDLSHALDLTAISGMPEPEKKILKGIVKFGQVSVKQIMMPRTDITAFEYNTPFLKLREEILASQYSRVPVYRETIDKVSGILYVKDLLPYMAKDDSFKWQALLREPFFVPENKKNDDLLKEFQHRKNHMAVVVDEFGGTSGIVTLEDVIEEIVGDINDEFDDDELVYSRLDEYNFVFEGKVSLSDFSRKLGVDASVFTPPSELSPDTLAGFIIELTGSIPKKGETVNFKDYKFTVESADNRKIKRVKVTIPA